MIRLILTSTISLNALKKKSTKPHYYYFQYNLSPVHSAARRNTAILHLYKIIDKPDFHMAEMVKMHATHVLCTLPSWLYFGSCPEGQISSRTPVCLPKQAACDSTLPVNPELSKNSSYRHIFPSKTHSMHTRKAIILSHN